jgi:hypothetical protein
MPFAGIAWHCQAPAPVPFDPDQRKWGFQGLRPVDIQREAYLLKLTPKPASVTVPDRDSRH